MVTNEAVSLGFVHHWLTSFLIRLTAFQHLIAEHPQGVCEGPGGRWLTLFFGRQTPEFLLEKAVLLGGYSPGALGERAA